MADTHARWFRVNSTTGDMQALTPRSNGSRRRSRLRPDSGDRINAPVEEDGDRGQLPQSRIPSRLRPSCGFTAVELMVATVVSSLVVLGVYGVLRQAQAAERAVTEHWTGERLASSVAIRVAEVVDRAVALPGQPAVTGGVTATGAAGSEVSPSGWLLLCVAPGSDLGTAELERAGWLWRYDWEPEQDGPRLNGGSGPTKIRLLRRRLPLSGSTLISPDMPTTTADDAGGSPSILPEAAWSAVPAEVVATGLDGFDAAFRLIGGGNSGEWGGGWDASEEGVPLVRLRVRSGDANVTVVAGGRISGPLVPEPEDAGNAGGEGGGG